MDRFFASCMRYFAVYEKNLTQICCSNQSVLDLLRSLFKVDCHWDKNCTIILRLCRDDLKMAQLQCRFKICLHKERKFSSALQNRVMHQDLHKEHLWAKILFAAYSSHRKNSQIECIVILQFSTNIKICIQSQLRNFYFSHLIIRKNQSGAAINDGA